MAHAWHNGIYLTRWLPDLAFGYGYPFFVYREAAPLYAVLLPFLAGLPLPAASNLFYAVTILLGGAFMFLWVRDLTTSRIPPPMLKIHNCLNRERTVFRAIEPG